MAVICTVHRAPFSYKCCTGLPCLARPNADWCCLLQSDGSSPLCCELNSTLAQPSDLPNSFSNILAKSACPNEFASRCRPAGCGSGAWATCGSVIVPVLTKSQSLRKPAEVRNAG